MKEPMAWRKIDDKNAHLLCCHCGHAAIFVYGHGACELAGELTGRVICEECDRLAESERDPFREERGQVGG